MLAAPGPLPLLRRGRPCQASNGDKAAVPAGPSVAVLGGGFGGLYTALRVEALPWAAPPSVTLVARDDRFCFKPLLYELLAGELGEEEV